MLNLFIVMLNVIMLNVVMLSVVAPELYHAGQYFPKLVSVIKQSDSSLRVGVIDAIPFLARSGLYY